MKTIRLILAFSLSGLAARADASYTITERGPDWKVLQKTTVEHGTNRVHRYVELATGLNYTNTSGQLVEAREEITLLSTGGAIANQGRHTVSFPADIYNGVIEVVTPDGRHLKSRPLGISYDDGSNTVFIATLKSAQGYLTASNQVTYRDAFTGFKADLVCTYRRGGFESDLVFRQQPPTPGDYGLDDTFSTLQMVTEFFNTADPEQIPAASDDWFGLQDTTLKFGKLTMTHGKAFAFSGTNDISHPASRIPASVYKSWTHTQGRTFLIESVPVLDLAEDLSALPLTASIADPKSRTSHLASRISYPASHPLSPSTNQILLATAGFTHEPGVVLDYNTVADASDNYTFAAGQTYYLTGSVNLTGTTTIEAGAILKYDSDAQLAPGTVVCTTTADDPAILTSVNDDSVGSPIAGSTGVPVSDYSVETAAPGGYGTYLSFPEAEGSASYQLQHLRFWYAHCAIADDAQKAGGPSGVEDSQFIQCGTAWLTANPGIVLHNDLFSGCQAIVVANLGGTVEAVNVTADHCWTFINDTSLNGVTVNLVNSLVTEVTTMMAVTNWSGWTPYTYPAQVSLDHSLLANTTNGIFLASSVSSSQLASAAGIYQAAASAGYYLASASSYRNAGTTNIDSDLLTELKTLTTYAPQDGGWPDTNGTSLGYHYPANEDSDHDGLPDWWEWHWFGSYAYSGTNIDANGSTFHDDYAAYTDPNIIHFSIEVTNNYLSTTNAALQLNVTAGVPFYYTVSVDDTNFLAATNSWNTYASSNITASLGTNEGWHELWVGVKGLPTEAAITWQRKRLKLDTLPPQLILTNPASGTVTVPLIQVQGFSPESLSSISYDLSNAVVTVTNQQVLVLNRYHDTKNWEFTTNTFQAFDLVLTNGVNTFTLHATDLAGNVTTTNVSFTLDYATATNPVVRLTWPQDRMQLCGTNFTLRGTVDDVTATIAATFSNTNVTNIVFGVVERTGVFWVDKLPLADGTNWLTLNVTNAAGFSNTTNLSVVKSTVNVKLDSPSDLWQPAVNVTGTISETNYAIWVNGIQGTNHGDGTWNADKVPVTPGGVASFDMTAYPAAEAPDDSAAGHGVNPRSVNAKDVSDSPDKQPGTYLVGSGQYMQDDVDTHEQFFYLYPMGMILNDFSTRAQTSTHWDYAWLAGLGGAGLSSNSDKRESWDTLGTHHTDQDTAFRWAFALNWVGDGLGDALYYSNGTLTDTVSSGLSIWTTLAAEHCNVGDSYPPPADWISPHYGVPDLWFHANVAETYKRKADTIIHVQTGGRALPGRQSLWHFSGGAEEVLNKRTLPPFVWGTPLASISPTKVVLGVVGALMADGTRWLTLPEGQDLDVTPSVAGKDYFKFGVGGTKYKLHIDANGHNLDNETPEFCVGQKVTFAGAWDITTEATNIDYIWNFSSKYVNHSSQANSHSSVIYDIDLGMLTNAEPYAWWYSGGDKNAYLNEVLHFSNGQIVSVSASGKFDMYRPSASMVNSAVHGTPLNLWLTGYPTSYPSGPTWSGTELGIIGLGVAGTTNNMSFLVRVISSDFSGDAKITQLCTIDTTHYPTDFNVSGELDNSDPYGSDVGNSSSAHINKNSAPSGTINEISLDDAPQGGGFGSFHFDGSFVDYIMFNPDASGSGIYVSLGKFTWETHFAATYPSVTIAPNSVSGPSDPDGSDGFPSWTDVFSNQN